MATSPRLKYPFVAGIGMTVYLVTTNVTAAKMAAAASSRVLMTSPSLVLDFAPKAKDARTRASWGHSGADPPQPSPHTDYTVDPGISPGHGPRTTDLGSRILDVRCQSLESDIQDPISKIVSYKGLTGCHRRSGIGPKSP